MAEITAAVPSYNHAGFIEKTLWSIFSQSLQPKKLIVIDDGSNDDSVNLIERVLADCPFEAQFISRENRGLSSTLNEICSLVTTDYFAYVGSDDIWLPDLLMTRCSSLEADPQTVIAHGPAYLIDENGAVFDSTVDWPSHNNFDLEALLNGVIPVTSGVMWRMSALKGLKWNEDAILEDYEMFLKLAQIGTFAYDPAILAAWRIHSYNTSGDHLKMTEEWIAAQQRTANEIGLSQDDLVRNARRLRFMVATDLVRDNRRYDAGKMLMQNLGGGKSLREYFEIFARLAMPPWLHKSLQQKQKAKQMLKYADIRF